MELANYIKKAAENMLKFDTVLALPAKIAETDFYLASAIDETILAHGTIKNADGVEYKIGTKK